MPCGLCNTWIEGEWIDWNECFAPPTQENRILVHTSSIPYFDVPCVLHLVLSETDTHSWYFFCRACGANLKRRLGFPVGSKISLRPVSVPLHWPVSVPWEVEHWPVLIRVFRWEESSDSEPPYDLSDNNPLYWDSYLTDV